MGHLPIGGAGGSLEALAPLPIERKIYIHINNTNPILLEDSPERRAVEERGTGSGHGRAKRYGCSRDDVNSGHGRASSTRCARQSQRYHASTPSTCG